MSKININIDEQLVIRIEQVQTRHTNTKVHNQIQIPIQYRQTSLVINVLLDIGITCRELKTDANKFRVALPY